MGIGGKARGILPFFFPLPLLSRSLLFSPGVPRLHNLPFFSFFFEMRTLQNYRFYSGCFKGLHTCAGISV